MNIQVHATHTISLDNETLRTIKALTTAMNRGAVNLSSLPEREEGTGADEQEILSNISVVQKDKMEEAVSAAFESEEEEQPEEKPELVIIKSPEIDEASQRAKVDSLARELVRSPLKGEVVKIVQKLEIKRVTECPVELLPKLYQLLLEVKNEKVSD